MASPLPIPNFQLVLAGFLRKARAMQDSIDFLTQLHTAAFNAVAAGDEFVTEASYKGQSNIAERNIPAVTLLELCESALQILEAESKEKAGIFEQPGSVRYGDFSSHPSTLG